MNRIKIIKRILICIILILLLTCIAEIALRIIWSVKYDANDAKKGDFGFLHFHNHPLLGEVHNPNMHLKIKFKEHPQGHIIWRNNNHGLREDYASYYGKSKSLFRLLVLGDSHTDGVVNNNESYANRLEYLLNLKKKDTLKYEALNAGVGGYTPLQEYLWFREYGVKYEADILILGFYAGNDVENLRFHKYCPSLKRDKGEAYKIYPPHKYKYPWLNQWSLLTAFIWNLRFTIFSDEENDILGQSLEQVIWMKEEQAEVEQVYDKLSYVIDSLKRGVSEADSKLLVFILPDKLEVERPMNDPIVIKIMKERDLTKQEIYNNKQMTRRRVTDMLQAKGIEFIDLYRYFRENFLAENELLYWNTDWHLNVKGHELTAKLLYSKLQELGWI